MQDRLRACQEAIQYEFRNRRLLEKALTHSSDASQTSDSNERLEFLGDAILGVVVSEHLFRCFPDASEGELTKIKSVVVSARILAKLSAKLGLHACIALGKGMVEREKLPPSVLANVFEALVAALYIDGGMEVARRFVLDHIAIEIGTVEHNRHQRNYKSLLQQYAQRQLSGTPTYRVTAHEGPEHERRFQVVAVVGEQDFGTGWGRSKKDAEQNAARETLKALKKKREVDLTFADA